MPFARRHIISYFASGIREIEDRFAGLATKPVEAVMNLGRTGNLELKFPFSGEVHQADPEQHGQDALAGGEQHDETQHEKNDPKGIL